MAFETSREGTLTSIFRIELRSFRVPNSWWDCTGAKQNIVYKEREARYASYIKFLTFKLQLLFYITH